MSLNKLIKFSCAFLMSTCACATLISCGKNGDNGLSAYEIAVKNGFDGTEAEWLESLKGENGKNGLNGKDGKDGITETKYELYTKAVENNEFSGTYMEFLKEVIGGDYSLSSLMNESLFSVVSITTTWTTKTYSYDFFGNKTETGTQDASASGSGVLFDVDTESGDAYIITNYHMVYSSNAVEENGISTKYNCYLYGYEYKGYEFSAEYIGGSIAVDLAVLKVSGADTLKGSRANGVEFANPDTLYIGEPVYRVGNDNSEGLSVSSGELSLLSHECEYQIGSTKIKNRCIRATALHNGGSSGGGLFNEYGEIMGIIACKVERTGEEALCYSVPVSVVEPLVNHVISNYEKTNTKTNRRCLIGVTSTFGEPYIVYNESIQAYQARAELVIHEVNDDSIVKNKLLPGDVLKSVTINGKTKNLYQYYELAEFLYWAFEGDTATIIYERNGVESSIDIELTYSIEI